MSFGKFPFSQMKSKGLFLLSFALLIPAILSSCHRALVEHDAVSSASVLSARQEKEFHVAPGGDDANPGTRGWPFATLARAQTAVREWKAATPQRAVTVSVHEGSYFLDAPLIFTPKDSGRRPAPVTWRAAEGERPLISGGVALKGFKKNKSGYWELHIPEVERGEWRFSQLFVNGARRLRPRLPREGSYFIEKDATAKPGQEDPSHDRLHFHEGDLPADFHNLGDVELVVYHIWSASRMRIKEIDPQARVATLTAPVPNSQNLWSGLRRNHRYFLENVREALGEPGEWYLDSKTGVLTYIPLPEENIKTAQVIAPRLTHLVKIEGDPLNGKWVEHLRFENLDFAHTNYVLPPEGYGCAQAEVHLDGAIRADGARDCQFKGCSVSKVATYAIQLNTACKNNLVEDCDLYDLGAGGVQIGAKIGGFWFSKLPYGDLPDTTEVIGGRNTLRNNTIAHGGRIFPAAVGVWIGGSPYNQISHNDIYDLFYTGISPGWVWGYKKSHAHHNIIEYNHIRNIGQRVLSDMGGIYTLGISPGTVLRYNHIHDVYSYAYGGWGIYFDEGSTYVLAENNLVYRVKDGGFHQHYGRENWVVNNIFAYSEQAQVKRSRFEEHTSYQFLHNIVYWKSSDLFGGSMDKGNFFNDYNLYWKEDAEEFDFVGKTLEEWQALGHDEHSLVANPRFLDPAHGDFRLGPDSPALRVGFTPFSVEDAGRLTPSRIPEDLPRPASPFLKNLPFQKPPPRTIREGFEETRVGQPPQGFVLSEENKTATVRVTDDHAASGRRSLKFTDTPGQKYNHNPHIYTDPEIEDGIIVGRFQVRMEPGARLSHEWRTSGQSYKIGPSIEILPSGELRSRGKKLTSLPLGQWAQIEIRCKPGTGIFDLALTLPGEQSAQFPDLPCDEAFDELRWYGFVSMAEEESVFYIDDLYLKRE